MLLKVIKKLLKKRQKLKVKVVAGLGNPGGKYENTPHNVGFDAVDRLAAVCGCQFKQSLKFKAEIVKTQIGSESVVLIKPQTFMNLSGESIGALLRFYKVAPVDLIVLFDDVDLELGRIRVKPCGGSGGHNGLKSVIQHVGMGDFVRVRMGVGRGESRGNVMSHVLHKFTSGDRDSIESMVSTAVDSVYEILESGVDSAMNRFNASAQKDS